eukprot:6764198-Alexandrium_andersonii.AAC.1
MARSRCRSSPSIGGGGVFGSPVRAGVGEGCGEEAVAAVCWQWPVEGVCCLLYTSPSPRD